MNIQVEGEGPLDCKICFIGEAPGATEVRLGRPFVGAAGDVFDRLLRSAGILRSLCRVTNVVKERPPQNDITHFIDLSRKVPIITEAGREYIDYLHKELAQCKANVFVPLGNVSLFALTQQKAITKRRGSILSVSTGKNIEGLEGRKVIPTIHPAATFPNRQPICIYFISHDLRRIKNQSAFPEIALPERNYILRPTYTDCLAYLIMLRQEKRLVAFDIETANNEVSCISFAASAEEAISIPFRYEKGDYFRPPEEEQVWRYIARVLEDPKITKVAQFGIYDATFMLRRYGINTRPLEDTMVAHGILYPDFPKGLDFMTSMLTLMPYYKDEGKEVLRSLVRDDMKLWEYNAKDSIVTFEILPKLLSQLEGQGNLETYQRQVGLIEPLLYAQERGTKVILGNVQDPESGILGAAREAETKAGNLRRELNEIAGRELNPASSQQLREYFYIEKGFAPYISRSTGRPTVDNDALKRLARRGSKEASLIRKIRGLEKLSGTYYRMKLDEDGRLRCTYNPVGTKTGRLSSSKTPFKTGGNMQNMPPRFKRFLVPDEGYILFEIDLAQAENRIVAWVGPVPTMRSAFEAGLDIHSQTAAFLHGVPADSISSVLGSSPFGNGKESQRFWGKQCNHALNYGLGYRKFALKFEMGEREARDLVEKYHRIYPGVRQNYQAWIKAQLAKDRIITNPYGRKRRFMDRWEEDLFRDAYAQFPQSTVADKINKVILYIYNKLHWVEFLGQIHDSITFQISLSYKWGVIEASLKDIQERLEEPVPWKDPFVIPAEIKVGLNLGEMVKVGKVKDVRETWERLQRD